MFIHQLLQIALESTRDVTVNSASKLVEHPLATATPGASGGDGNHLLWTLGHLCFVESSIQGIVFGTPNRLQHTGELFQMGSKPRNDPSAYPTAGELLQTFKDVRNESIARMIELPAVEFEKPTLFTPPGFEKVLGTKGQALQTIAIHTLFHTGQLADMRRVVGVPRDF